MQRLPGVTFTYRTRFHGASMRDKVRKHPQTPGCLHISRHPAAAFGTYWMPFRIFRCPPAVPSYRLFKNLNISSTLGVRGE